MTRIILSIISIILCTAALSASTYAWYLLSITSGTNTVRTGDYKLTGSFNVNYPVNAQMSTNTVKNISSVANGTYPLHLEPDSGSYTTGYAILTFTDTSETPKTSVYYVSVGTGIDLNITTPDLSNLEIKAHWGVPTNYNVTEAQIVSGTTLTVVFN
ncbi:MAG: hypothetical protein IJT49_09115 [Clostridia bacterium]|nr:hypothetical protein [Clostridia bacterium]